MKWEYFKVMNEYEKEQFSSPLVLFTLGVILGLAASFEFVIGLYVIGFVFYLFDKLLRELDKKSFRKQGTK